MFGINLGAFAAFLVAVLIIIVIPGPDHMLLAAVSLKDGKRAGVTASAGIATAMIVHTLIAISGMGVAITAAPIALGVIRVLGAIYLIYMGISEIRQRHTPVENAVVPKRKIFK